MFVTICCDGRNSHTIAWLHVTAVGTWHVHVQVVTLYLLRAACMCAHMSYMIVCVSQYLPSVISYFPTALVLIIAHCFLMARTYIYLFRCMGMLIRVTARAILSIERGGQFCGPRCIMWCSSLCWSPALSLQSSWVLVYLAAWRDSWQLIVEVKTRLGQSTAGSCSTIVHDGIANCHFCLNAGLDW